MAEVNSSFIPVSHVTGGERIRGLISGWSSQCDRCDKECELTVTIGAGVCRYGVNFHRVSKEMLLFGFLMQGARLTKAQQKILRRNPQSVVKPELVAKSISILEADNQLLAETKRAALGDVVREYRESSMYKRDLLELLRPEIQKKLAFLHDYRQFVAQVKQNINVVLQTRFPNEEIDSQLQKVTPEEAAIYWSAALMDDKLSMVSLLIQPELLFGATKTQFRLHGFVLKHVRIYNAAFVKKNIQLVQSGYSDGQIIASQAFATVPHTLLDNALKYSSRGGKVTIGFREDADYIDFSVISFGPKIEEEERKSIFELFSRGIHGIAQQEEGSGVGLYLAQAVARDLGTEIKVKQNALKATFGYETVFSIRLRRSA